MTVVCQTIAIRQALVVNSRSFKFLLGQNAHDLGRLADMPSSSTKFQFVRYTCKRFSRLYLQAYLRNSALYFGHC